MDNAGYTTLNRQSGLMSEMRAIANNMANLATTGFRKEGVIFAEHIADLGGEEPSLSMASAEGRLVSLAQGALTETGGAFDLAIDGAGFFQIETPDGARLTRAGSFTLTPEGELSTSDGYRVLDAGGGPVFVPMDAGPVGIAGDGTLSAGGNPIARIGLFVPTDPMGLVHDGGTRFAADAGIEPLEEGTMLQGFLESSNVSPVSEIARMIEVQRAYELGQGFLDNEDRRIRGVIDALGRT